MSSNDEIDDEYRNRMQALAECLEIALPGCGFALLVFEFHKEGRCNYISNANREDMLTAMKEFIARAEGRHHDAPTTKQ